MIRILMANTDAMQFEKLIPILYSEDLEKSIAYYIDKLAFDTKWIWDEAATFGGVSRECVELFFSKKDQGNPGTWICISVDNVDEYYEIVKERGANILFPPADREWNMREMLVQDPDGHIIRFGHRLDD